MEMNLEPEKQEEVLALAKQIIELTLSHEYGLLAFYYATDMIDEVIDKALELKNEEG